MVLAQLILHFVGDPERAAREMRRVLRPGGTVAACSWDSVQGMEMLRHFWVAAARLDLDASDKAGLRLGREGELVELFTAAGFEQATESTLTSTYSSFHELWSGFLSGIGPAGSYTLQLSPPDQEDALRRALFEGVGSPPGAFELAAMAAGAPIEERPSRGLDAWFPRNPSGSLASGSANPFRLSKRCYRVLSERGCTEMKDVLIREVPEEVVTALDARASRLGLSRSEYLRRRLAQDVASSSQTVTATDLADFAETFCDLTDPEVMRGAWE